MGLSMFISPKSMNTCLESDPQTPVSSGFVITQSGRRNPGSGISTRSIGVRASAATSGLSVSGCGTRGGWIP